MPRAGASASAAGETVKVPLPSEDQSQASSVPARRETTSTRSGDHEGGIEADAELADQRRALAALRGLDPVHEGLGAGARDRAERLDHLVAAHADAVVLDGEGAVVGIDHERDAGLGIVAEQGRVGDRLVAQLLAGIGGVGDQLAQKHVLVGIDRVHHQVQQLGDIGLERPALGPGFINGGHGRQFLPRTYFGFEMARALRQVKAARPSDDPEWPSAR